MRERGFTLIEMLVVLAIIAMALTVVPSLLTSLPGARLHAAADGVAAALRELRTQAIGSGTSTALLIDPASRSYATLPDGVRHALPEAVKALDIATTAPLLNGNVGIVRFFADGTATGGIITLRDGGRAAAITVDWLTGRVRLAD